MSSPMTQGEGWPEGWTPGFEGMISPDGRSRIDYVTAHPNDPSGWFLMIPCFGPIFDASMVGQPRQSSMATMAYRREPYPDHHAALRAYQAMVTP